MKNVLIALALLSGSAHAASTAELTVKGLVTPMACTPPAVERRAGGLRQDLAQ